MSLTQDPLTAHPPARRQMPAGIGVEKELRCTRMATRATDKARTATRHVLTVLTLVGAALLFGPQEASAQTCINDVWKAHGNNQNVTCTANDVTLASATNI